jgi:hypothetical protein
MRARIAIAVASLLASVILSSDAEACLFRRRCRSACQPSTTCCQRGRNQGPSCGPVQAPARSSLQDQINDLRGDVDDHENRLQGLGSPPAARP